MNRAVWVYFGLIVVVSMFLIVPLVFPAVILLLIHYAAIAAIFWIICRFEMWRALEFGTILALLLLGVYSMNYSAGGSPLAQEGAPLVYGATFNFLFNLPLYSALAVLITSGWRLVRRLLLGRRGSLEPSEPVPDISDKNALASDSTGLNISDEPDHGISPLDSETHSIETSDKMPAMPSKRAIMTTGIILALVMIGAGIYLLRALPYSTTPSFSVPTNADTSPLRVPASSTPTISPYTSPRATMVPVVLTPLTCVELLTVSVDAANLRDGPGTNYRILGVAHKGDRFRVGEPKSNTEWLHVSDESGRRFWVSGKLGQIRPSCTPP